jgi:hypothetical protein
VRLKTGREFVQKAFLLGDVFRGLLDEHGTDAITINPCMGTVMGLAKRAASLPEKDGYMAFRESDLW